ncbi:unnamed protein product [Polarella glacialis]|uniref:SCP domain-containing protein n=1 Tax=Polarella glacialis TaxID=89957 RepID=A0A813FUI7_POLGL|nr:unnamed protein product [Polarella glacialis]
MALPCNLGQSECLSKGDTAVLLLQQKHKVSKVSPDAHDGQTLYGGDGSGDIQDIGILRSRRRRKSRRTATTTSATATAAPSTTSAAVTTSGSAGGLRASLQAWTHFGLLQDLRKVGFTCPGGQVFAPNAVPLKFDCRLWKAAQLHSQDMADNNYFSHTSQDGRSPWDRASAQGISANAENIAAGSSTAQGTLDQWKSSDGHCLNMMNPSYPVFAVGYGYHSVSTYQNYWTQMFSSSNVALDESCHPVTESTTNTLSPTTLSSTATTTGPTATTTSATTTAASSTTSAAVTTSGSAGGLRASLQAWTHFGLLQDLRKVGFACPGGQVFAPNAVPLKFDCRLWKAAQLHSQDLADNNYFSHTSQDGRSPWDRASAQGISANAENIAAGSSTAQGTLDQWKSSDGHCLNMMNPSYPVFAVGYGYNSGSTYQHYWTQMLSSSNVALDESCYPVAGGLRASLQAWTHFGLLQDLRKVGFTCPGGQVFAPNAVPLKFDCRLWKAAQLHSQDMADNNYFSHTSQDGRSPWDRASAQGISANAENIAAGSSTAQGTLDQWKSSDGHCLNMMNPSYPVFAVGYGYHSVSTYQHYWTQMLSSSNVALDESCYPVAGLDVSVSASGLGKDAASADIGQPWAFEGLVELERVEAKWKCAGGLRASLQAWTHFGLLQDLRKVGFTCPGGQVFAQNAVPLKFDCRLWKAAQLHSQDMADNNYFSHTSQDGRSPWDRASAQGISANAENIAAGSSTAQGTLDQWKSSDGHCLNMMNPSYPVFAVGYGYNSGSSYKHYWTQMLSSSNVALDESCYPVAGLDVSVSASGLGEDSASADIGQPWAFEGLVRQAEGLPVLEESE